jgi:hypothetical protein
MAVGEGEWRVFEAVDCRLETSRKNPYVTCSFDAGKFGGIILLVGTYILGHFILRDPQCVSAKRIHREPGLIHVEIALQDPFLEVVGLLRLGLLRPRGLSRRGRHLGHGLGPVERGGSGARSGRRAVKPRSEGERGSLAMNGAFGSRPKLLGPVEALLVWARRKHVRRGSCRLYVACLCLGERWQDAVGAAPADSRGRQSSGNRRGTAVGGRADGGTSSGSVHAAPPGHRRPVALLGIGIGLRWCLRVITI